MIERGWLRPFHDPIPLPNGGKLRTLRDAANYTTNLPKREHDARVSRAAIEALMLSAEHGGGTMLPRIGAMRALYPGDGVRVARRKPTKKYRIVVRSKVAARRTVEFLPTEKMTSGSRRRASQGLHLVRSCKCTVIPGSVGITIECPAVAKTAILQLCAIAEEKLPRIQQEPLTAKMVQEILAKTARPSNH